MLSIVATLSLNSSQATGMLMVFSVGLLDLGWWLSPGVAVPWKELVHPIVSMLAVWVTTFIVTNGIRTLLSLQSLHETFESEIGQERQILKANNRSC